MTKIAAQCTRHCAALVLRNFFLLFPSFLSRCNVNPSLLLGLCLCLYNPFSLLIVVYYFLLPGFICICCFLSLSLSLSCCVPNSWLSLFSCWTCVYCLWWILDLLFLLLLPHPSNIYLPLSSLFLPSTLMCVSCGCLSCNFLHFCHPSALTLLIVVSFLLATNKQSPLPFPLSSSSSSCSM